MAENNHNWTDEQEQAIRIRACDLLVSAAAGSGKTAVLVERIITMITESTIDIDRLLIVTFTNAAASEMKEKIGKALEKLVREYPDELRLQNQLTLLNKAQITTIHSFCNHIVRKYFNKLNLDPSFRIADEGEAVLLKTEVIEELFEELYQQEDEDFHTLVESYGADAMDFPLMDMILHVYRFVESSPWPDRWLAEMAEMFDIKGNIDDTVWVNVIKEELNLEIDGMIEQANSILEMAQDGAIEYVENLLSDLEILENLKNALQGNFSQAYEEFNGVEKKFSRLKSVKKDNKTIIHEKVKKLRDDELKGSIKNLNNKIFFQSVSEMEGDLKKLSPIVKKICSIVSCFSERYAAAKKEKNMVDFSDLEHFCLSVLVEADSTYEHVIPTESAKNLRKQYDEILIDEYQDSNYVQDIILYAVSGGWEGKPNRFMVGDVKQSIYKFRMAAPRIFMEKYNSYKSITQKALSEAFASPHKETRVDLHKNFRSRENIVHSVNFIFEQIMSKTIGEITYDERAALHYGELFPFFEEAIDDEIEIHVMEKNTESDLDEELEELTAYQKEARMAAQRIKELMQSNKYVYVDKQYRPLAYKDIVILLRAPRGFDVCFIDELTKEGIPSYAETNTGYFRAVEVRTILNLLHIIDNPRQDIPLLSVLKSPIFFFSADDFVEIKKNMNKAVFFDCMTEYEIKGNDSVMREKIKNVFENLQKWRDLSKHLPIDELLWTLYRETNYYQAVGLLKGGEIRQANLKALFEKAAQFESTSYKGLFNFIKFIQKVQKETEQGNASVVSENENLVRIMSIHKSKGLEFPVVFLCGMGKRFNGADIRKAALLHQDLGFGLHYVDLENRISYPTLARAALARKMTSENLSEEMRILYVALTRAKEKLILMGSVQNVADKIEKWERYRHKGDNPLPPHYIFKGKTYLDWVAPVILKDTERMKGRIFYWTIEELEKEILADNQKEDWEAEIGDTSGDEEIAAKLSWRYPYHIETGMNVNLSISEIKRRYHNEQFEKTGNVHYMEMVSFKRPNFTKGGKKISGAEKGVAYHTFLEKLDVKRVHSEKDVIELLNMHRRKGFLTEEEIEALSIEKIMEFLRSPLAARMRKASKIYKESPFTYGVTPAEVYDVPIDTEIILVHGVIDCFFYEDGEIVLVDYKTDYIGKDIKSFINQYRIQMELYEAALNHIKKVRVKEKIIYSIDSSVEIVI